MTIANTGFTSGGLSRCDANLELCASNKL